MNFFVFCHICSLHMHLSPNYVLASASRIILPFFSIFKSSMTILPYFSFFKSIWSSHVGKQNFLPCYSACLPKRHTPPKAVKVGISLKEGRVCCVASKDNTWLVTLDLLVLICRYRGKTYRATVKIVRTSDQVADFCRRVCAKLECCPNLFSPVLVAEVCPENCSIHTKTKYSEYWLQGLLLARMLCVS